MDGNRKMRRLERFGMDEVKWKIHLGSFRKKWAELGSRISQNMAVVDVDDPFWQRYTTSPASHLYYDLHSYFCYDHQNFWGFGGVGVMEMKISCIVSWWLMTAPDRVLTGHHFLDRNSYFSVWKVSLRLSKFGLECICKIYDETLISTNPMACYHPENCQWGVSLLSSTCSLFWRSM